DPVRREAVARTTLTARRGAELWPRVETRLDDYADDGEQLRAQVCERVDAQRGSERGLAERTLACLAMHDQVLDVVVELLAGDEDSGDPLDVVDALGTPTACEQIDARASVAVPPPPQLDAAVRSLRRRIAAATAVAWAGRPEQAIASLQGLLAEVDALGYPPLQIDVHHALGKAMQTTDVDAAIEQLSAAHALALRLGADLEAVATLHSLATVLAERSEDIERAAWMLGELEGWRARLGLAENPGVASLHATIARARGDLDGAIEWGEQALALSIGASPAVRTTLHASLGAMYAERQQLPRAREHTELARELAERAYGPTHRRTLRCRANLVGLEYRLGHFAQAETMGRALLDDFAASGSAELPETAVTRTMLGMVARARGEFEGALQDDRRALDIRTRVFGERHRLVAESLEKIALDELGAGRPMAALTQLRRVVALRRELHPSSHPAVAQARIELARALLAAGEAVEADREAHAALAQLESSFARDDVRLYGPFLYAGMAALGVDDFDRARVDLDRAAELGEIAELEPLDQAELELARAR
ncbi:MAG: tetratricopeptide repeat protein, partial [Deltaproteobacteria bacterium]|nr:tetratricopeptide repeat protein [Nannocystaceae bacterium]